MAMGRWWLLVVVVTIVAAVGCSDDDRPSDSAWTEVWVAQRDSVPGADAFIEGGEEMCSDLLGDLRVGREELLPTPADSLDDAVHAWIDHAESIAFECPDDPEELDEGLHDLDVIAAEVDAGLAADEAG